MFNAKYPNQVITQTRNFSANWKIILIEIPGDSQKKNILLEDDSGGRILRNHIEFAAVNQSSYHQIPFFDEAIIRLDIHTLIRSMRDLIETTNFKLGAV